jgi:hypothetical protein
MQSCAFLTRGRVHMAELKAGEPFGLDPAMAAKIDWKLALQRIVQDLRTDFIYAPHLAMIFHGAGDALVHQVTSQLKAGQYSPGLPVTIEVPKSFRIRVASTQPRLGPNYSRPGSILLPSDRLFYQALADQAAPIVQAKTDWTRSFRKRTSNGFVCRSFPRAGRLTQCRTF